MAKANLRILLADDHALIGEGIAKLLEPHFETVDIAADGQALLDAATRTQPDLVITDIAMPRLNGIEAARKIRNASPRTKIIILSMHSDPAYVRAAREAGATGYVLKRSAASVLLHAVGEVLAGRTFVFDGGGSNITADELTPRQIEVLRLIAQGRSAKEIAFELDISSKTAEFHRASIMERLGLHSTAQLTRYALERGVVEAPAAKS